MRLIRPTYANVASSLALFIALGGTSYAVAKLPKNSVGSDQLRAGAVTTSKVAKGAITAELLAPGTAIAGPRGPRGADGPQGAAGTPGAPGTAGITPTAGTWKALETIGGWDAYGATMQTPSYRKDGFGTVEMRGVISRVSGAPSPSVIAVLPAGYRPSAERIFAVLSGPTDSVGRIDVKADGSVLWMSGSTDNSTTDYTSLEGIRFSAGD